MSAPHEVTLASVRKLKPNKRNARTHPKRQIQELAELIRRYGWTYPILVDEDGYIIAGHARYEAALHLRLARVPTIVMKGLSEAETRAFALADNKVPTKAGWDRATLAAELGELAVLLPDCGLSLELTGFEPFEIDELMGNLIDAEQDPIDELPETSGMGVTKRGDLWQMGPHRLLCGDARNPADVRTVMDRDLAAMVITDPPFNVRIGSVQGRGQIKHRNFSQAAGEMTSAEFTNFLRSCLSCAAQCSSPGSIHFIFIDWRHIGELLTAGKAVYSEWKNLIVWNKTNAGQGSFYRSQHELIFVFKNGDAPHANNFELGQHGRTRSNVWTYAGVNTFRAGRLDDLRTHPTVKPVALVMDALRDCSRRGDIVLDLFMGSGTTILAAERIGRRACGLEIDPLYVDAAIRRWQAYTRRDAILADTGQTFDEVRTARRSDEPRREPK